MVGGCQAAGTEGDPVVVRIEHEQAKGLVRSVGGDPKEIPDPPPPPAGVLDVVIDAIGGFLDQNTGLSIGGAVAAVLTVLYRRRRKNLALVEDTPEPTSGKTPANRKTPRSRRKSAK